MRGVASGLLRPQDTLPLLERRPELLLPVRPPVRQCRRQRGPCQAARGGGEHALVPLLLEPAVQPRLPALGQLLLAQPAHRHLLHVRDALLLLLLRLLGQHDLALLLLGLSLARYAPQLRLLRFQRSLALRSLRFQRSLRFGAGRVQRSLTLRTKGRHALFVPA